MSDRPVAMCDRVVGGDSACGTCDRPAKHYKDKYGEDFFLCDEHRASWPGQSLTPYPPPERIASKEANHV